MADLKEVTEMPFEEVLPLLTKADSLEDVFRELGLPTEVLERVAKENMKLVDDLGRSLIADADKMPLLAREYAVLTLLKDNPTFGDYLILHALVSHVISDASMEYERVIEAYERVIEACKQEIKNQLLSGHDLDERFTRLVLSIPNRLVVELFDKLIEQAFKAAQEEDSPLVPTAGPVFPLAIDPELLERLKGKDAGEEDDRGGEGE